MVTASFNICALDSRIPCYDIIVDIFAGFWVSTLACPLHRVSIIIIIIACGECAIWFPTAGLSLQSLCAGKRMRCFNWIASGWFTISPGDDFLIPHKHKYNTLAHLMIRAHTHTAHDQQNKKTYKKRRPELVWLVSSIFYAIHYLYLQILTVRSVSGSALTALHLRRCGEVFSATRTHSASTQVHTRYALRMVHVLCSMLW